MPSLVFQLYIASLENVNSVKSGSSSDSYSRVGHHNDRGNHRIFDENKNWGSRDEDHPDRDDNEVSFTEKVGKQEKNCVCALLYFVVVFFFLSPNHQTLPLLTPWGDMSKIQTLTLEIIFISMPLPLH